MGRWRCLSGVMPVGAHGGDGCRPRAIQVDENVTGVLVAGVGLHIDVATFTVAHAQEPDCGRGSQLLGSPKPFPRECLAGPVVNQADQVEVVGHGGQLFTNGLQGEKETTIFHDRHFAVGTNRRTMNSQRTAHCVLTVCLSRGGRGSLRAIAAAWRNENRAGLDPQLVMDPKSWTQRWPFLRWWAALKMKESQCPERVKVTHPA